VTGRKSRGDRWPRIIVHADMDAFYAAVEQRDHPELRGRPVLVGGSGRRSVVSTASYEARPYGCHSAMPMAAARRLCPDAVVIPPDFERYHAASNAVMAVFESYSPCVEPLSLDEAFLDMTGAEGLFGSPGEMARRIKRDVREATKGLTVSVGVATTKFVAKVASDFRKPDGFTVVPGDRVHEFLWPLPVSRLWGVGPKTCQSLEQIGLRRIGDVARAKEGMLVRRFGETGTHIHRLAWGVDDREVETDREAKSIGAECTLEEDITGEAAIRPHIKRNVERVARQLRREGLVASGVRVKLKTSGFRLLTRQGRVQPPTDSERDLERTASALLHQFDLTLPMRLVGIAAFNLGPVSGRQRQGELFEDERREQTRALERLVDAIRERFGDGAVTWGADEDE